MPGCRTEPGIQRASSSMPITVKPASLISAPSFSYGKVNNSNQVNYSICLYVGAFDKRNRSLNPHCNAHAHKSTSGISKAATRLYKEALPRHPARSEQLCFCCHRQIRVNSQQQITHVPRQSVTFHEFEQRHLFWLLSQHCSTLSNYAFLTAFRSQNYAAGQYGAAMMRIFFAKITFLMQRDL